MRLPVVAAAGFFSFCFRAEPRAPMADKVQVPLISPSEIRTRQVYPAPVVTPHARYPPSNVSLTYGANVDFLGLGWTWVCFDRYQVDLSETRRVSGGTNPHLARDVVQGERQLRPGPPYPPPRAVPS